MGICWEAADRKTALSTVAEHRGLTTSLLLTSSYCFVVVQSPSHVRFFMTPWTVACQAPLPSTITWRCSNSYLLTSWCSLTISSSPALFSFCLQSFPASGPFPVSWLFASGGPNIGASASVLPVNIQGWFPLGLSGLISLQSRGLSRVFSSTTIGKY